MWCQEDVCRYSLIRLTWELTAVFCVSQLDSSTRWSTSRQAGQGKFTHTYAIVEGDALEKISNEIKAEVGARARASTSPWREENKASKEKAMGMLKAIEAHLLQKPWCLQLSCCCTLARSISHHGLRLHSHVSFKKNNNRDWTVTMFWSGRYAACCHQRRLSNIL